MTRDNGHVSWREALDFAEQRTAERPGHAAPCADCEAQLSSAKEFVRTLRFASSMPADPAWAERTWQSVTELAGSTAWSALESEAHWARVEAARLSDLTDTSPSALSLQRFKGNVSDLRTRLVEAADQILHTVRATLLADSWTDLAVGVRGSTTAAPRILVYETDAYTVSLSFQPGPDPQKIELGVLGQVTPRRGTDLPVGPTATLRSGTGSDIVVSVDEFGEFRFDGLTEIPRRLLLTIGTDQIEMGPLPDLTASN